MERDGKPDASSRVSTPALPPLQGLPGEESSHPLGAEDAPSPPKLGNFFKFSPPKKALPPTQPML